MEEKKKAPKKRIKRMPEQWQVLSVLMAFYDFIALHGAFLLALLARFDFRFSEIPLIYLEPYSRFITVYALCALVVFWLFRMYQSLWAYASFAELARTLEASMITGIAHIISITVLFGRMPLSYYFGGLLLQTVLLVGIRFAYRFVLYERGRRVPAGGPEGRIMLIGAGSAGQMLLRDVNAKGAQTNRVVCIIDDDPNKQGRYVEDVPVVGGREDILANVDKYRVNKIYLAIPSATAEEKRDILSICNETSCELKQLPGMYQFVRGEITVSAMKDVSMEDLLGREPVRADLEEVFAFIHGKRVLVTGGGGSIGSELCRQIAAHEPEMLIIFDIYENNAYDIQLELRDKYPQLDLVTLIGSVRDSRRIFQVFETYRPQIVYHAAAHKHVPLMEDSPCEAIKNNAIGTYKTADAAMVHGCERFVMISTDKAVNPTNVMGASKRLCEMIIQCFDAKIKAGKADELPQLFTHMGYENADKDGSGSVFREARTEFVAVRFGNVLGSNGSVIPVFRRQIEKGGPVTVTHPDIIRYFMTIPEAVSLVMLAGTYAHGGEIFVLEMGSPVKIDTLARNMIKHSGLRPDVDIKIEYTGLRPGEKLYEEKLMAEEGLRKTDNKLIHIGNPIVFEYDRFLIRLEGLMNAAYANSDQIRELLMEAVSTYHPLGVNGGAKAGEEPEDAPAQAEKELSRSAG